MNHLNYLTSLLVLICFSFFACTGPEGPMGPQGPQGPTGPTGDPGSQGDDGNANVKTTTFTVSTWMWTESSSSLWFYIKELSIITPDIAENGIVLVFVKSTNSEHWQTLPYTWPGTYERIMRYWYTTEYMELDIYSEYDNYEPTSEYTFKVAAIEGNSIKNAKNAGIDIDDSNQLKIYFNIE